jgi:hypothetical protein
VRKSSIGTPTDDNYVSPHNSITKSKPNSKMYSPRIKESGEKLHWKQREVKRKEDTNRNPVFTCNDIDHLSEEKPSQENSSLWSEGSFVRRPIF